MIDPSKDFWQVYPQLKLIEPFAAYAKEKNSSDGMWMIKLFHDPDEEENMFFRFPPEERRERLEAAFPKVEKTKAYQACEAAWEETNMTVIERALKTEKETLRMRSELMRNTTLTLDRTEYDDKGKPYTVKGTATQINTLQKDALKVYENYERIFERFTKEKQKLRVRGGDELNPAEMENFF